ncbi:MAG: exodeoxyribonuclease VII large subunit [Rhodospirillales bacterium]
MPENREQTETGGNIPVFSVTEISHAVKQTVEGAFPRVRVKGEISGFKRAASGHLYMALKDDDAVIDGVCWRTTAGRLAVDPEDGLEIIATGRITTYPGRSKYQLVIDRMEIAGEGALLKLLEDRKRKLAAEGLFDEDAKQLLPVLPSVIGVVTSPTGAVIRDILHRVRERFPVRVIVWPALVQGDGAAEQIAAGIRGFNALPEGGPVPRPDVLIVARGGGSLEDLWAFNEEIVVRAAAESDIPLISAVGHETDWTLIDLAADVRAPTPTAAAEIAVPVRADLMARVTELQQRLTRAGQRYLTDRAERLQAMARGLPRPGRIVEDRSQRLDDWSERLANSLNVGLERRQRRVVGAGAGLVRPTALIRRAGEQLAERSARLVRAWPRAMKTREARLSAAASLLESYSYRRTLERGFALVSGADGAPVRSVAQAAPGDTLSIEVADGRFDAVVGPGGAKRKQAKRRPSVSGDDGQGSLL